MCTNQDAREAVPKVVVVVGCAVRRLLKCACVVARASHLDGFKVLGYKLLSKTIKRLYGLYKRLKTYVVKILWLLRVDLLGLGLLICNNGCSVCCIFAAYKDLFAAFSQRPRD